jgi:cysteinyl-tRNA synthetase
MTDLKLYNTLTRKIETFKPITDKKVGLYTCGPTVYNYPHIGNYRAYITADILKRTLATNGYQVNHVMNLTDVDDKTIRDSQKEHKTLKEFTEYYTEKFYEDLATLDIQPASTYTKATDYIKEMVTIIEKLIEKDFAYTDDSGSVYFNVQSWKDYGHLSGLDLQTLKENAAGRIKKDNYDKENAHDFALWKAWDEADGEVFWETSLGKGRPGWHIECSAMSTKHLGNHFDIHTGGIDLIFPHHENEIAQSECSTGEHFVNYWVHNEWLLVEGKKMSKSDENFITVQELIKKGYSPLAYRYFLLQAHYRKQLNFTWEALDAAEKGLTNLYRTIQSLGSVVGESDEKYVSKFNEHLTEDLNTPQATAVLHEMLKSDLPKEVKLATVYEFDKILGLGLSNIQKTDIEIPDAVTQLAKEREIARKEKNWAESDRLRDEITSLGFDVKDTEDGQKISSIQ